MSVRPPRETAVLTHAAFAITPEARQNRYPPTHPNTPDPDKSHDFLSGALGKAGLLSAKR